jgi:POT family proton-dependent oligopeptide transporter
MLKKSWGNYVPLPTNDAGQADNDGGVDDGAYEMRGLSDAANVADLTGSKFVEHGLSNGGKDVMQSVVDAEDDEDNPGVGEKYPTAEELLTLRRVADKIPWNFYLIAFVELAERFSFYGSSVVFTNFIQQPLPPGSPTGAGFKDGQSGALGLGQRASTGVTTFYSFWCFVVPLFGAYIADTRWGRYKTVCICMGIALVGHIILIVSAIPGIIEHPKVAIVWFTLGLIVTGLGTGGFKANISPLVAEQYKGTQLFVSVDPSTGERVIVDPALTISRIYIYFYQFINIGALTGQVGMTYAEKYVGFWLAYTLPTIVFLFCPLVLWAGRNRYEKSPPTGSVLATALRILRHCMKGKWSLNPWVMRRRLAMPGFWDAARPSVARKVYGEVPSWMSYDDRWVDEVRRGFKACAVFTWFPIYCASSSTPLFAYSY